jgi:TonB-linked SusC/RagA family outer membrane protein
MTALTSTAQSTVSGLVFDAETKEALPGVAVSIEGTTRGMATGLDGAFSIELSAKELDTAALKIQYLGYLTSRIEIQGRSNIEVFLAPDNKLLDEVVITAIGIAKEKRKLGYSVTEVGGDELRESREVNIVNSLNSKVAGVQVTSTSGAPGASSAIRIRGNSSINGSNDPLFVIDGIPIDNSYRGSNFTDQGNRALDINPDDIENMVVLKGGAATALYGVRAANGAIIINTKQGKNGKTEVNFNSTTTFDVVNKLPQKQDRWGQGTGGQYIAGSNTSWGPRLDTMATNGMGGLVLPGDAMDAGAARPFDNANNFFQTGVTLNNNLNIRGGNEKSGFFLSLSDLRQDGVIPMSAFNRSSVRLSANSSLKENLQVKASANYVRSRADRPQRGSNLSGVMLGLMRAPASYDLENGVDDPVNDASAWSNPDGSQRTYHAAYDNPYWSINKNRNEETLGRFIGLVEFTWQPFDWLSVTERAGLDTYNEDRISYWDRRSNEFAADGGAIFNQNVNQFNVTNDLIVTATHRFGEDFNVSAIVGHAYQTFNRSTLFSDGFGFVIDDFYDISNINAVNLVSDDLIDQSLLVGVFADLSMDYKRTYYLTLTGRQDWISNLPANNNSFFYPSASLGMVLTELMDLGPIAFGKIRGSYAITGNGAFANYLTSNYFVSTGSTQGLLSYAPNSLIGSNTLTPEFNYSSEVGIDLRSKGNRARLDLTYFDNRSTDQIVEIPISNSTGYSTFITNIGEIRNYGLEALISYDVLEFKARNPEKLSWTTSINMTVPRSEVISLTDELDNIALPSVGVASTQSRVVEGYQYGVIYGSRWARNDNGDVLVNEDGYPLLDPENGVVGDPNPDFLAGWRNRFRWKNLSLSFLFDIRVGGDMWNGTRGVMRRLGTADETDSRDETIVWDGVVATEEDGELVITDEVNTQEIRLDEAFYSRFGLTGVSEDNIETVNWFRMRDISISYSFSPRVCEKIGIANASLALTARNLFLITNYTGIDPETSLGGATNAFGRDYFNNPNTRSYGFNLSVTF